MGQQTSNRRSDSNKIGYWNHEVHKLPKQWPLSQHDAEQFVDIVFVLSNFETVAHDVENICSNFSLQIRTHPIPDTPLRFEVHEDVSLDLALSEDGLVLADHSSTWCTARFSCEMTWGKRYYLELFVESIHICKFIMIGVLTHEVYLKRIRGCLGTRFYGYSFDIKAGTKLGFVFDFASGNTGGIYAIIDDIPLGRVCEHTKDEFGNSPIIPVISLACGNNRIRIVKDAKFPKYWSNKHWKMLLKKTANR